MKNIILIVDPFSTGKMYAKFFSDIGYQCYAVLSSQNVPQFFQDSFDAHYFENKTLLSLEDAKKLFSEENIKAVVIGAETGVFAGEFLADYFNQKGNSVKTTEFRRNKFAMQQQLKLAGLDYIKSKVISRNEHSLNELPDYTAYILKPLNSAGSENVSFCADKTQLIQAISQIKWGEKNITGEENQHFLVQEFIQGQEFVVDMVVYNQQIYPVSLCRYKKSNHNGSHFVYEHMEMLDPTDPKFSAIIEYAKQCAVALGFEFGPVHMEIMHSPQRTVMIEAGGRLHGGVAPHIFQKCYQPSLLAQAVNCYLSEPFPYPTKLVSFAKVVFMINRLPKANLDSDQFQQRIKQLPSFSDCLISQSKDLALTIDLISCPCFVSLVSESAAQLDADEQALRQIFNECCTIA